VIAAAIVCSANYAVAAPCESVASLALPDTTITAAQMVAAGAFTPEKPAGLPIRPPYRDLPAFCRVAGIVRPAPDSEIKFEVWMPAANWNGKFVAVGNGGFSGEIWYWSMIEPLSRGYATAGTNGGHDGAVDDGSFALGHPEKWKDLGYRAVHEMTLKSKAIIAAYYDRMSSRAYWTGCSAGGRQGLIEAQRFPEDFDGIIAGAPANYASRLLSWDVWIAQALRKTPESVVPATKVKLLHQAVLAACDAKDGVADGVLENPATCHFDPAVLQCKGSDSADCLSAPPVEAVKKFYSGPVDPSTYARMFPGLAPGSELGWIRSDFGAMVTEPWRLPIGCASRPCSLAIARHRRAVGSLRRGSRLARSCVGRRLLSLRRAGDLLSQTRRPAQAIDAAGVALHHRTRDWPHRAIRGFRRSRTDIESCGARRASARLDCV